MDWLNYHHLFYFWLVAREESIARAAALAHVASPTISKQIAQLEQALRGELFHRAGRTLVLTDFGRLVFDYADEIFAVGRELQQAVRGVPSERPLRLVVGISQVLPKLITRQLLRPAFQIAEDVQVQCREGRHDELLADLATHRVDLLLSDAPASPTERLRATSHLLGQCGVTFLATRKMASRYRRQFPRSLNGAPFLLPAPGTSLRRELEHWFASEDLHPHVIAEFADTALMKVFGQDGLGVFAAPSVIEDEIRRQHSVVVIGRTDQVRERFYAISLQRRAKHPAILAIFQGAKQDVFREGEED